MNSRYAIFAVFFGGLILLPTFAFALTPPSLWPVGFWGPILSCTADANPSAVAPNGQVLPQCKSLCDLMETFQRFIYLIMSLAVFVLTPFFFVWGGIRIILAGASPEGVSAGRRIITGTIIGIAICIGAFLIVNTFIGAIASVSKGNFTISLKAISCNPAQIPGANVPLPNCVNGICTPP
jgi:hypothetical protein